VPANRGIAAGYRMTREACVNLAALTEGAEDVSPAWCWHGRQIRDPGIHSHRLPDAAPAPLRTRPDGRLTLTAYGELFARDVRPALESFTQSRSQSTSHAP
jgi:hypothetical protein